MRVDMRLAMPEDFEAMGFTPQLGTLRSFALLFDGRAVALATMRYAKISGPMQATVDMKPEVRKFPITLHKWAKAAFREATKAGVSHIVATADKEIPRASAWLARLGFDYAGESEGGEVWQWHN